MTDKKTYIIYKMSENGKYFKLHPVGKMDPFHATKMRTLNISYDGDNNNIVANIAKELESKMGLFYRIRNKCEIKLIDENSEKGQELKNKYLAKRPETELESIKFVKEYYKNYAENDQKNIEYYNSEEEITGYIVTAYNILSRSQDEYYHEISLLIEDKFPNVYHFNEEGTYMGPIRNENGWTP